MADLIVIGSKPHFHVIVFTDFKPDFDLISEQLIPLIVVVPSALT